MFAHRYAFLIACQTYSDGIDILKTPIQDVKDLGKILKDEYKYEVEICLDPTQEKLLNFLNSISLKVSKDQVKAKDTQVLIYYAGHGVALEVDQGIKGYLIPIGAKRKENGEDVLADNSVGMDVLVRVMEKLPSQQVLAILDCCFAGSVRWSTFNYRGLNTGEEKNKISNRQHLAFYSRHRSLQVLTSTSHNQKALDSMGVREDALAKSPFARTLLQALEGGANGPGEEFIAIDDIKRYLNRRLNEQYQLNQGSELFPLEKHDSGTFLFLKKNFNIEDIHPQEFDNPYKGLKPYEFKDAGLFFGRDKSIEDLGILVKQNKPIVVAGASGSGKSSLVKAGLLPWLLRDDYQNHQIIILTPGRQPLEELNHLDLSLPTILVIDQLEQLITQATDSSEEAVNEFLEKLQQLNQIIICTVRTDFEYQIFKSGVVMAGSFFFYRLQRLEREDIYRIIALPAQRVGRFFYPEQLVQQIVDDFLSYPNSLPLLSLVLFELFEQDKDDHYREFTQKDYQDLGGLTGVLSKKLDEVYARFSTASERTMLKNILVRMTSLRGGKLAGKRIYQDELSFEEPEKKRLCAEIMNLLTGESYRLVMAGKEEANNSDSISLEYWEPSHDVVVQAWGTRREWIDGINNGTLALREELTSAVMDYKINHQNSQYLWHNDPNLMLLGECPRNGWARIQWDWQQFKQSFTKPLEWFTHPEETFIQKSFKRRKLERGILRILMSLIAIAVVSISYFFYQLNQEQRRTKAASLVREAQVVRPSNPSQAFGLLKEALSLDPDNPNIFQETAALYEIDGIRFEKAIFKHTDLVYTAVLSRNGDQVLTASYDKTAKLWNMNGDLIANFPHDSIVNTALFSPNEKQILTASDDGTAKLWDLDGNNLAIFPHSKGVMTAVFSPDGEKVLTASVDSTAKLWTWTEKTKKGILVANLNKHKGALYSAVFSPDGRYILTASVDKTAKLWNLLGDTLMHFKHSGQVTSAVFCQDSLHISQEGLHVLTASWDKTAKLWNLLGDSLACIKHDEMVRSAVFSPNSQQILTSSNDKNARLSNLSGDSITSVKHNDLVTGAIFSPNGKQILTMSNDRTVKLSNLEGELLINLEKHTEVVTNAVFSTDGQQILTASNDGTAKLWNIQKDFSTSLNIPIANIKTSTFSPDGSQILIVQYNNSAKLFDLNGGELREFKHAAVVNSAIFSHNGMQVLTASADSTVKLWSLKENKPKIFKYNEPIRSAQFSPDEKEIFSISYNHVPQVWNLNNNKPQNFSGQLGPVSLISLSPAGQLILTALNNRIAKLRNLAGEEVKVLNKHIGQITSAIFSPNGQYILTAATDKTAKLWNLQGELLINFNKHNGTINSAVFSPDGKYILTASADRSAKLWNLKGEMLADFNVHKEAVNSAVFSSDNKRILTSSHNELKIWYTPHVILDLSTNVKMAPLSMALKQEYELQESNLWLNIKAFLLSHINKL